MKKETVEKVNAFMEWLVAIRSYIIMAICLLLSYFAKAHIIVFLKILVGKFQECSHVAFAIGVCSTVVALSAYLIWKILEGKRYVAHRTAAISTYCACVYMYFRFVDNSYTFWGWSPYFVWMDLFLIPYVLLWFEKVTYHTQAINGDYDYKVVPDTPISDFTEDAFGHSKTIMTMVDNYY